MPSNDGVRERATIEVPMEMCVLEGREYPGRDGIPYSATSSRVRMPLGVVVGEGEARRPVGGRTAFVEHYEMRPESGTVAVSFWADRDVRLSKRKGDGWDVVRASPVDLKAAVAALDFVTVPEAFVRMPSRGESWPDGTRKEPRVSLPQGVRVSARELAQGADGKALRDEDGRVTVAEEAKEVDVSRARINVPTCMRAFDGSERCVVSLRKDRDYTLEVPFLDEEGHVARNEDGSYPPPMRYVAKGADIARGIRAEQAAWARSRAAADLAAAPEVGSGYADRDIEFGPASGRRPAGMTA